MDVSTLNTIVGVSVTFIGSGILFGLGAILTYVRSINRKMEQVLLDNVKHGTMIENHSEQLRDLWKTVNELKDKIE